MEINLNERGPGLFVLSLSGEVDMYTSPEVRTRLIPLFEGSARGVVVDLSGVSYMDSSGIATLVEGLQKSTASGVIFRLAGLTDRVRGVFELARLVDIFEVYETLDRAVSDLSQGNA